MQSVVDEVRAFIVNSLGWHGSADQLTDDLQLIQAGVLDSIGILSLVEFLESNYHITVQDSEIIAAHLGSLTGIEQFVKSKTS
jgi:acyl carrier protein